VCAQAIGDSLRELGLEIRAGCHTGEIELDGDSVLGIAVHIGALITSMAGPGEVLVSSTVKDLVAGSGLVFEDRGEHELKGVPDRWHLPRGADLKGSRGTIAYAIVPPRVLRAATNSATLRRVGRRTRIAGTRSTRTTAVAAGRTAEEGGVCVEVIPHLLGASHRPTGQRGVRDT